MILQYLKNSIRKILNNSTNTLINIIGLSIGVSSFFILFLYYSYENSYDKFIPNSENIYRLSLELNQNNKTIFNKATSVYAIGPLLKNELPEVTEYARAGYEKCLVYLKGGEQKRHDLFWTDSTFLSVIPVEMLVGNRKTALAEPYTAVLSDELAKFYFGDANPINKTIYVNENLAFKVTGVFKSLPGNSHLNFKLLLSLSTGNVLWPGWGTNNTSWGGDYWLYTYINLKNGSDKKFIKTKLDQIVKNHLPPNLNKEKYQYNFSLQAIQDIHLTSQLENEFKVNGSKRDSNVILLISLLIISIAWINFFNLTNSALYDNAREISIRKINGATKGQVIKQFFIDVLIVNTISVLISILSIILFLPVLESISGKELGIFLEQNKWLFVSFPVALIMGVLISGLYPAIILASILPQYSLKGKLFSSKGTFAFKKSLVVFQLSATILLIIGVIAINKQLKYIQSKDLGYQKEQIINLDAPCTLNMDSTKHTKFKLFKQQLLSKSQINSVTSIGTGIGGLLLGNENYQFVNDSKLNVSLKSNFIDEDFVKVFEINWLAGDSAVQKEFPITQKVIINESASKLLGFSEPINALDSYLSNNDGKVQIAGVIADFHQQSLKCNIQPTIFFYQHPSIFGTYSIKIKSSNSKNTISVIKDVWNNIYPNDPFIYSFLDKHLNNLYFADQQFGTVLLLFTLLSIFVACLGLLGLILITTKKNMKEIGIRKTNGAKTHEIMFMLLKDYSIWILAAFIIASPIAYFTMTKWLENFAYKTELSWWIFALAGFIAMGIALLTVSFQSWRAATRNPIESLRYE